MKDKLKTSKGITLIALVITIIVLLILAGVAISMLSGDNGILSQAAKAKTVTDEKSTEEQIKLAATAAMANEKHEIQSKDELEKELAKYGLSLDEENSVDGPWTITKDGITYTIKRNGDVINGLTAADLKDNADAIGALVTNYKPTADKTTEWRIFFADNDHIYLIAKDYISLENLPLKDGVKPENTYPTAPKAAPLTNVYNKYTGSKNIVDNEILKSTIPTYHQWVNAHQDSTNENIMAVAYLLDTDIWTKQYGTEKAEYVIGGPTLEMFCESYNKKTHTNEKGTIEYDLFRDNTTLPGYKLKWSIDSSYGDENAGVVLSGLDTTEYTNLYVINSMNNASAYWIPSVPFNSGNSLFNCKYSGKIGSNGYTNGEIGFRPLVCLKSNVILVGNSTDGYTIQ